jgi:acetyl esterase/lipase
MMPSVMNDSPAPADARLAYGDHPSQFVDFRPANGGSREARPFVVMIHGGYWRARRDLTYAGHLCIALGEAGMATANIEYRRVGEVGGGWPGTFEDVKRATEFARSHASGLGGDVSRTIVMGHSAGGHLALWLSAAMPDLIAAVSLAGVVNLKQAWELRLSDCAAGELMGGSPDEIPDLYAAADPAQLPSAVLRILIHGDADGIVPIELSRTFPQPHRFIELPGVDHFALIDPATSAWARVLNEILAL